MKKILTFLLCCISIAANAQIRSISGTVTFKSDGSPAAGALVLVQGTNSSAIADSSGKYTINATQGNTLTFSLLGYTSVEAVVGVSNTVNAQMAEDATAIEDVVVIGYGVQQKKLVTGATVQVKGDDIAKLNTSSALGALQSQTPGVNIIQSGGMPGEASFKVIIRGMGTVNNYGPQYVIDGVAGGDINSLNPADIESIDVLKDAASAAIYGSRSANGVILVTTKKGRHGTKENIQVSLDGYYGWQNPYRTPDLLNAQEYMMIQNEAAMMDGGAPIDWSQYFNTDYLKGIYEGYKNGTNKGTDWVNASRNKNAPTKNYTFNLSGGTGLSVFSVGLGYTSQEGIFGYPRTPKWERYTARINSEYTLFKHRNRDIVKLGENLTYNYQRTGDRIRNGQSRYWSDIWSLLRMDPLTPIYDEKGEWQGSSVINPTLANPIGMTQYGRPQSKNNSHNLRSNVYLTVEPIKNLVFRSSFGYNYSSSQSRQYSPLYTMGSSSNTVESMRQDMSGGYSWSWENTATYKFTIANRHNLTALLGQSIEKWGMGENLWAQNGLPQFHDFEHAFIGNTGNLGGSSGSVAALTPATAMWGEPWGMGSMASIFGRVSYDYLGKYMATFVLRADGSSNFARGNRWGYFPSVSAGWVATEEPFMKGVRSWLDFLKIRASWGQNGNSNVPNFQYLGTITSGTGSGYNFGGDKGKPSSGAYADILPNVNIGWETSEQIDLGFDANFLRNRLSVTFDYYVKNTKDWLVRAPQLASYGTGAPYINGGDIRNNGVELALRWNDNVGEFKYGAGLNFAYNKNRITSIANEQGIIQGDTGSTLFEMGEGGEFYRSQVGRPVGFFYGYQTQGLFQNQAQIDAYNAAHKNIQKDAKPGDVIWLDRNGDDVIDDKDKGYLGNPYPDVTIGLNLNFAYKGFDLNITGNGSFGGQIIRSWRDWGQITDTYTSEILGRWHGEGTSNRIPRVSRLDPNGNYKRISDLFMENADYFKMQNVTLGYDFKHLLPSANFLSQLRVYVTAQNLFVITGYSGMDPELGQPGNSSFGWSSGIDVGYYPTPRTWMIGANLKF